MFKKQNTGIHVWTERKGTTSYCLVVPFKVGVYKTLFRAICDLNDDNTSIDSANFPPWWAAT